MSPTTLGPAAIDESMGAWHLRAHDYDFHQLNPPARENTVPSRTSTSTSTNRSAGSSEVGGLGVAVGSPPADAAGAGNALLDALQLLGPRAEELPCRVEDRDLWFAQTPQELDCAKQLCAACPIRQLCLEAAVAQREPWGVWGGSIFDNGAVIAYKRPRGRPRKQSGADVAA